MRPCTAALALFALASSVGCPTSLAEAPAAPIVPLPLDPTGDDVDTVDTVEPDTSDTSDTSETPVPPESPEPPADDESAQPLAGSGSRGLVGLQDVDLSPEGLRVVRDVLGDRGFVLQGAYSTDVDWVPDVVARLAAAADAGLRPVLRVDYARPDRTADAQGRATAGATLPWDATLNGCLRRDARPDGGSLGPATNGSGHVDCFLRYLDVVLTSPGHDKVHDFVVGNEFNVSFESRGAPGGTLTVAQIAAAYRAARARIHAAAGHAGDRVWLGAVSPGTDAAGPVVVGTRTQSGDAMLRALLLALDPVDVDGLALHAYGGWVIPEDNGGVPALSRFQNELQRQIDLVDRFGHARTPLLLSEWSGEVHRPEVDAAKHDRGVPLLASFVGDAVRWLDVQNRTPGRHAVVGAVYFSWWHTGFVGQSLAPYLDVAGAPSTNPAQALRAVARDTAIVAGDPARAGTCASPRGGTPRTFAETGKTLPGLFADTWQRHGGLAVFGFPVAAAGCDVDPVTGRVLYAQWLQRQRFEYHPEFDDVPTSRVLLSHLGRYTARARAIDVDAWQACTPGARRATCECIGPPNAWPIGHWVCGELRTFWRTRGMRFDADPSTSFAESLALHGYPLTEEVPLLLPDGSTLVVQWFERTRLERHEGQCGTRDASGQCTGAFYVQGGLLGCVAAGFAPGSVPGC